MRGERRVTMLNRSHERLSAKGGNGRLLAGKQPLADRAASNLGLLRHFKSIVDLYAEIANRAFQLRMSQQQLYRSEIFRSSVGRLRRVVAHGERRGGPLDAATAAGRRDAGRAGRVDLDYPAHDRRQPHWIAFDEVTADRLETPSSS